MVLDDDNGWFDEMNDQKNWLKPYFQLGSDSYQTRSGHGRCSIKKKAVLKNFTIFTGKHVLESLFNNVAGLRADSNTGVDTVVFL